MEDAGGAVRVVGGDDMRYATPGVVPALIEQRKFAVAPGHPAAPDQIFTFLRWFGVAPQILLRQLFACKALNYLNFTKLIKFGLQQTICYLYISPGGYVPSTKTLFRTTKSLLDTL